MSQRHTTRSLGRVTLTIATAAVLTLALAPTASAAPSTVVTGRVTGDGRPLQHVVVTVGSAAPNLFTPYASAETKRDGTYRMVVPSSAPAKVYVQFRASAAVGGTSPSGYADKCAHGGPVCVDDGNPTLVLNGTSRVASAALGRAGVIRGRVIDSLGRGVGGLNVHATATSLGLGPLYGPDREFDTATDANGNYTFPTLRNPSRYQLVYGNRYGLVDPATPAADGYSSASSGLTLAAGETENETISVRGGGAITGRVVDQFGAPYAGAVVDYYVPSRGGWPTSVTAADGSFSFHYLHVGTAPLCATSGSSTTCPDGLDHGVPTTVREFGKTSVRIVLRRTS